MTALYSLLNMGEKKYPKAVPLLLKPQASLTPHIHLPLPLQKNLYSKFAEFLTVILYEVYFQCVLQAGVKPVFSASVPPPHHTCSVPQFLYLSNGDNNTCLPLF